MSRLRLTPLGPLTAAGAAAAVLSALVAPSVYGDLPQLPVVAPLTLAGVAVLLGVAAVATRRRIARRPGTRPVEPLLVARTVALAKASAVVGALLTGAYAGLLAYLLSVRSALAAAQDDLPVAAAAVLAAAALTGAALVLERSCRTPDAPDEDDPPGGRAPGGVPPVRS